MKVQKYTQEFFNIWNEFVANSKQGTFLLNRNFMEYHCERFADHSLIFFDEKERLIAVLPANLNNGALYSHQGLSYGGLIYGNSAKTIDILECFDVINAYAKENGITKLIYKRTPAIYQNLPSDEDSYALFRNDAKLFRRDIGYTIDIQNQIKWIQARRTEFNKSVKNNLFVKNTNNYNAYHNLLSSVLELSHQTKPVHTKEEMTLLAERFPENIQLVCSFQGEIMLSGVWLFIEKSVVHIQYIATSDYGKTTGAFEAIVRHLLELYHDKQHLSFGISTEDGGRNLNEGLTFQKESFGGRGTIYDFYELTFN